MDEPRWLIEARKHIGLREIPGQGTAPTIRRWLGELRAWWEGDEVPWCGTATAAWMQAAGQPIPKHWYRARGWLDWGVPLDDPELGCVVVFERGAAGHVGLVVGRDRHNRLLVLGGNQGDAVSIASFPRYRALGFRWPAGQPVVNAALPLGNAGASTGEA